LQISNSEAETYDKCERAHYYQFGLGLMPKQVPRPVRIGVLGHRILEAYYRTGLETTQRQEWYRAGLDELTKLFQHVDNDDDWDILSLLGVRFGQYAEHYATDRWRVIDVEGHYEKKLSDDITYAMRLDLLFRREVIRPTDERIAGMLREQLMTSQLIKDRLTLPISAQRVIAKRSISKYNCGLCGFLTPCGMSLDGRDYDESIILASDYEQNTYGYRQ
jgi:hypothetical protein